MNWFDSEFARGVLWLPLATIFPVILPQPKDGNGIKTLNASGRMNYQARLTLTLTLTLTLKSLSLSLSLSLSTAPRVTGYIINNILN